MPAARGRIPSPTAAATGWGSIAAYCIGEEGAGWAPVSEERKKAASGGISVGGEDGAGCCPWKYGTRFYCLLRPTQSVLLFMSLPLHCYSCTKICREIKRKHLLLFVWVVDFSANVFTQINLNCFYWYFTCCLFLSQVDDSGFGLWLG
jgi:hypothetical protein